MYSTVGDVDRYRENGEYLKLKFKSKTLKYGLLNFFLSYSRKVFKKTLFLKNSIGFFKTAEFNAKFKTVEKKMKQKS
jgi:hypothetical protein